jgi:hypothetical protein
MTVAVLFIQEQGLNTPTRKRPPVLSLGSNPHLKTSTPTGRQLMLLKASKARKWIKSLQALLSVVKIGG